MQFQVQDSGVAVRKRIIRILREICEKQPDFERMPEVLARIVRRISDEEGVRKLTIDTMQSLLFQSVRERDSVQLINKVIVYFFLLKIFSDLFQEEGEVDMTGDFFRLFLVLFLYVFINFR